MAMLAKKGLVPTFGFGNKPTDSKAYEPIPQHQNVFFYQIVGDYHGRRIESYSEVLPQFTSVAPVCQK
jgi:hypothetical protein